MILASDVFGKVVCSVLFRPEQTERLVPVTKTRQNGVVFVSVFIPVRTGNSGQIPAGMRRLFRSGTENIYI